METQSLRDELIQILKSERVLTSQREFFSSDIFGIDKLAALVVRPESSDALSAAAHAIAAAGYSVIGRGGDTSYTGGLNPDRETSPACSSVTRVRSASSPR